MALILNLCIWGGGGGRTAAMQHYYYDLGAPVKISLVAIDSLYSFKINLLHYYMNHNIK